MVLQDLIGSVSSRREGFGDSWHAVREKLLWIYGEALSSNCRDLVQMIQVITLSFSCKGSDW
jgi:zinc finger FYVE domain-containing protein 26